MGRIKFAWMEYEKRYKVKDAENEKGRGAWMSFWMKVDEFHPHMWMKSSFFLWDCLPPNLTQLL